MEKLHNKLVRDNILDIIIKDGKKPISRILNNKEYKSELIKKFNEELLELFEANNSNNIKSELSDILEINDLKDKKYFELKLAIDNKYDDKFYISSKL